MDWIGLTEGAEVALLSPTLFAQLTGFPREPRLDDSSIFRPGIR